MPAYCPNARKRRSRPRVYAYERSRLAADSFVNETNVGVHYYYSALSGRRVWVEGPAYLLNQAEACHQLCDVAVSSPIWLRPQSACLRLLRPMYSSIIGCQVNLT